MTAVLRDLVSKATPGPWFFREDDSTLVDDWPDVRDAIILQGEDCFPSHVEHANLRLAALAPELALLVADMAHVLDMFHSDQDDDRECSICALLARVDQLTEDKG